MDPSGHKYNATSAAKYARRWGESRNPKFEDFRSADCTNFVSQCLLAGGKAKTIPDDAMKKYCKSTTKYWYMIGPFGRYCNIWYYSTAWSTVSHFYTYWTSKNRAKCYEYKKIKP